MSIYTKQLEDENEHLRQKLVEAQEYIDRVGDNPLEESLRLLIYASIKHQKKILADRGFFRSDEMCEIKLNLPRQIGLSTTIVRAAANFFDEVDVLHVPQNAKREGDARIDRCMVRHHASVNNFIGRKVSCVIVDPWSVVYGNTIQDWQDIKDKIMSRFDKDNPYLLIMAG